MHNTNAKKWWKWWRKNMPINDVEKLASHSYGMSVIHRVGDSKLKMWFIKLIRNSLRAKEMMKWTLKVFLSSIPWLHIFIYIFSFCNRRRERFIHSVCWTLLAASVSKCSLNSKQCSKKKREKNATATTIKNYKQKNAIH